MSVKAKTTKKIVLKMECTECKYRKQLPIKRCKHFELGGDRKKKVCSLLRSKVVFFLRMTHQSLAWHHPSKVVNQLDVTALLVL